MKAIIFFTLLVLLAGCSASKRAHKYFAANPKEFAADCAGAFPCLVSDSTVTADTIRVPVNVDYTGAIDSIKQSAAELEASRVADSAKASKSLRDCQEVVADKAAQIRRLNSLTGAIKYLPCASDTIRITRTLKIRDTAKEQAAETRATKANERVERLERKLGNRTKIMWFLIIAVALYLAGRIFAPRLPFKIP